MSTFLLLVEFGAQTLAPRAHPPLRVDEVTVRPRGPTSARRTGYLVSDGVSAERLRKTGAGSLAYQGSIQRTALVSLLDERLARGLQVYIVFVFVEGRASEFVCDVSDAPNIELRHLEAAVPAMKLNEPNLVVR